MRAPNPACDDRTLVANIASMDRLVEELRNESAAPPRAPHSGYALAHMEAIQRGELFASARLTYMRLLHAGARAVLQTILQELDLPKALRKKIEAWSRYFSRASSPGGSRKDYYAPRAFYDAQLAKYTQLMADIHEARRVGVPHGVCATVDPARAQMAGPFTLVNTGGFDPETMARVKAVVERSVKLIEAKGLGVILYGDIYITNTISRSRYVAFYEPDTDELFVRANIKNDIDTVHTVIHELGHRLDFMFMRTRGSNVAMHNLYSKVRAAHRDQMWNQDRKLSEKLNVGDEITISGKTFNVSLIEPRTIRLKIEGAPPDKRWTHRISRQALAQIMSGAASGGDFGAFVTKYASKSAIENFAEMFAFWAMGKLPEQQAAWLVEAIPSALFQSNQSATSEADKLLEAFGSQRDALAHALGEITSWKKTLLLAKKASRIRVVGSDEAEHAMGMVQFWARVADLLRDRT